jgi:hypothetical protein
VAFHISERSVGIVQTCVFIGRKLHSLLWNGLTVGVKVELIESRPVASLKAPSNLQQSSWAKYLEGTQASGYQKSCPLSCQVRKGNGLGAGLNSYEVIKLFCRLCSRSDAKYTLGNESLGYCRVPPCCTCNWIHPLSLRYGSYLAFRWL